VLIFDKKWRYLRASIILIVEYITRIGLPNFILSGCFRYRFPNCILHSNTIEIIDHKYTKYVLYEHRVTVVLTLLLWNPAAIPR